MVQVVINVEERVKLARYKSWAFMALTVISLSFNLLFVLTMAQMGSRLTVMTQLFNTTRGTKTLVLPDILNAQLGDLDLLEKAFVQRFIEERNFQIPDSVEMERRWGPYGHLSMMSHPDIWKPVYRYDDKRLKNVVDEFPTHADNITILSRVGNNWKVQFDLWRHTDMGMTKQTKIATVHIGFFPERVQRVAIPGFYYNPLGMTITDYNVTTAEQ